MMEVAVFGVVCGVVWISSFTFLLPFFLLLKCSKSVRDKWFAYAMVKFLKPIFEPTLLPMRKKVFGMLNEMLSRRDTSKPLKVLEIGVGSGANLQYYPENSHLTALDMNVNFDEYFRAHQKKYPQIVYDRTVIAFAEDMKDVSDNSMDVVVSTYVFCSVNSIKDVLREVKRVLKPEAKGTTTIVGEVISFQGGKFLFLDHASYPRSYWSSTVQKFINPVWKVYFGGCHLTRHVGDEIKKAGFSDVLYEYVFPKNVMFLIRPQFYGIATK